jgi:hypothetical protein
MAAESILVFRDETAFTSYVKSVAAQDPRLLDQDFELLYLSQDEETIRPVLTGSDAKNLLKIEKGIAESINAVIDRKKGSVTIKTGGIRGFLGRSKKFRIKSQHSGANLALLGRLAKLKSDAEYTRIAFWTTDDEIYRRVIIEHLELGHDDLHISCLEGEDEPKVVLASQPSYHLIQKWGEVHTGPGVTVFYEGIRRGLFFEWGYEHPFKSWLPADTRGQTTTFFNHHGQRQALETKAFRDIGVALDFQRDDALLKRWSGAESNPRIPINLRFSGRAAPLDPELWILPTSRREELEILLETTPEDDLKNLLMAILTLPNGEEVFVLREVLSRRVPHLLPQTGRVYAPLNRTVPNLLLPCHRVLSPALRASRYSEAFTVKSGEITLLDDTNGQIEAIKFEERNFRPLSQLVDFIFDGAASRINECQLKMPFDIGEFAELDLIDPLANQKKKARPKVASKIKNTEIEVDEKEAGLFDRMKSLFKGRHKETSKKKDPNAIEIEDEQVVDEVRLALEEQLTNRQQTPVAWYSLAEIYFRENDPVEGVRCAENGLWLAEEDEEEAQGHELLRNTLGQPSGQLECVEDLYGGVLKLANSAEVLDRAELTQQTRWLWRQLQKSSLTRKKTRWLLWRELLKINGDSIEEARQREDLIAELALKGVEDREVPPFVRARLLASTRHDGAATGGDKALNFLERACEIVQKIEVKASLALALATLGYAYVELGESERGLQLAQDASNYLDGKITTPIEAICEARIAALRERAGITDQVASFERSLDFIKQERKFPFRKALEKWFRALAASNMTNKKTADLVGKGLNVVAKYPPQYRALLLKDIAPSLIKLNELNLAIAQVRELLKLPKSEFAATDPVATSDKVGREIIYYEELTATLDQLNPNESLEIDDASLILAKLNELSGQINEFTIDMALTAFRCKELDVISLGDSMAKEFQDKKEDYAALNIRLAILRRLAETKQREEGRKRLTDLIHNTRIHQCGAKDCDRSKDYHRLRLLQRIVELIPAFGNSEEGIRHINRISDFAKTCNEYVRPNLLSVCAMQQVRFGQRAGLMDKLEHYATEAKQLVEDRKSSGSNTDLMFWVLESCVQGVALIGEMQRGLTLTKSVAELTESGLSEQWTPTQFWLYRAMIQAGKAALSLGDGPYAEELFTRIFSNIKEKVNFGFDRIDLLQELISAVKSLTSAKRFDLTGDILEETLKACQDVGEFGQEVLLNLINTVADDIVRGESAYAMALKRWKGDEERLIRDRISSERITTI